MTTATYSARNVSDLAGVPLSTIRPSTFNPRTHFDPEALAELAASIRQDGLLQPIVVRRTPRAESSAGGAAFEIVAGERRWRAAQLAGLTEIRVSLAELDDAAALRVALVENLARKDLDPIEEAEGYARLNREGGMKQAEIAAAVNRSQPAVANAMRLLELPEDVRERIRKGDLSVSHGIALARYKDFPAVVTKLAEATTEHGLTAKRLEDKNLLVGGGLGYDLERGGLIARVWPRSANAPYMAACAECPLNARRSADFGGDICLRPDHLAALKAAWEAERAAKVQAQQAAIAAGTDGPALPVLSEMDWGTYKRFYGSRPEGCSEQCPCSLQALAHDGEVELVCTDPKRAEKLETAERKAKSKEKRLALKAQLDLVTGAIDELHSIDKRSLALVVAGVFHGIYKTEAITSCLKRHAPALVTEGVSNIREDLHDKLAELDVLTLLRIGVEAVLRNELREAESYGTQGKRTAWWLSDGDGGAELRAVAARMA